MGKDWRSWFDDTIFRRGQQYYRQNRVKELKKTAGGYQAFVVGTSLYTVRLALDDDTVLAASCNCPYALDGGRCKHQVAVLLKYEEVCKDEIAQMQEESELKKVNLDLRDKWVRQDLEDDYSYIDLQEIEKKLLPKERDKQEALLLLEKGLVVYDHMAAATRSLMDESSIQVFGYAKENPEDRGEKGVGFRVSQEDIFGFSCGCPSCSSSMNYYWGQKPCKHTKALFYAAYQALKNQRLMDATDDRTIRLFKNFQNVKARSVAASIVGSFSGTLSLVPKIKSTHTGLELSFRVGATKLYVVKNLSEFYRNVTNGTTQTFGKSTTLPLARENFDKTSQEYIDYIGDTISRIEDGYKISMADDFLDRSFGYFSPDQIKQFIPLLGRGLDDFFDKFNSRGFDYEDMVYGKTVIHFKEKNPKFDMTIIPKFIGKGKSRKFSGVRADITLPRLYYGASYRYFVDGVNLYRIPKETADKMQPLLEGRVTDFVHMEIGRNYLSDFYHTILPELATFTNIREKDRDLIYEYLSNDVEFTFYLDADMGNITCKAVAKYGDNQYNVIDCDGLTVDTAGTLGVERIFSKENEALGIVKRFLPFINEDRDLFHCNKDEDLIYEFVTNGVAELAKLGDIQATDSFQHVNIFRETKLSVGVSLSKGMLDLEVSSDDISRDELLEILASYRAKKKFHRLRDNSYVNLNDEALATLDDMLVTLQISEKDFLKDNMHVPVYRTLYLDKLLEENDGIYEDRDDHFKELVKGFKTVKDAEFKAPESLSKIMRNYQKTGFKWISTLEKYGLGGILCDDMGLGKTLQTISFLYKHYMDANASEDLPSLVVCPASLVYNWVDEFSKFAPEMKVVAVAGTVSEREEIIVNANQYQVLITSYDLLKRDVALYEEHEFYYEIIDEAQYIKNHTTAAAKAVKVITSRRRLALTGTPIENRLSELWSIFDFLMPGFLYKYEQFRRQFETPIVKYEDKNASERLKKMVAPFLLRRLKENVLKELPEKLEKQQTVVMEAEQQTLYDAQVQHLKVMIEQAKKDKSFNEAKMKILAEMTRLRQICCDPSLYVENYKGESAKRQACLDLVERAIEAGHRILIFSQFTTMLDLLKKDLKKSHINYFEITGSTKKEDRIDLVNRFNEGENNVFLISLKAGGTGLNLIGADMVIHYDPWWNLAAQNQATDRAHRIGQKKTVTVYKLITKGTIEEKIVELQNTKSDLAEEILSGETNIISKMTEADFLELLG
ncbi:Superfamily II DNA or RNA helicase, SNF2 family [Pseudobutyrivibrio sp. ACV-2]|uniref:DEAD/DEAH box helicase n=1 Tax=Pseudobutyrivibrio sp. ACV-2 TaxID=1520801 RepID=UPI0008953DDB|nr:DEAD/DEAH box helicase [Pseudobutyrivibrio sp. ACV-2]SEA81375.1 Superfamily II DNA or RNA helicase, SNF2 family [Pseudobutyrivibrio sp. ACV-2]